MLSDVLGLDGLGSFVIVSGTAPPGRFLGGTGRSRALAPKVGFRVQDWFSLRVPPVRVDRVTIFGTPFESPDAFH